MKSTFTSDAASLRGLNPSDPKHFQPMEIKLRVQFLFCLSRRTGTEGTACSRTAVPHCHAANGNRVRQKTGQSNSGVNRQFHKKVINRNTRIWGLHLGPGIVLGRSRTTGQYTFGFQGQLTRSRNNYSRGINTNATCSLLKSGNGLA